MVSYSDWEIIRVAEFLRTVQKEAFRAPCSSGCDHCIIAQVGDVQMCHMANTVFFETASDLYVFKELLLILVQRVASFSAQVSGSSALNYERSVSDQLSLQLMGSMMPVLLGLNLKQTHLGC